MRAAHARRAAGGLGGVLLLGALWLGPLPALARTSFLAHMTLHMGVIAVAAPLLVAGVAGGRLDPVRRWPVPFGPLTAALLEFLIVWSWHAPALHLAARGSATVFVLEQATFLVAGLLVWLSAFGGGARNRSERAAGGAAGLLLTSMHMTLLGALLALAPRTLYRHGGGDSAATVALVDQQLGGTLMLMVGGAAYLAGGLVLVAGLLRARGSAAPGTGECGEPRRLAGLPVAGERNR